MRLANDHVREQWGRYFADSFSPDYRRFFREMYRDRAGSDELQMNAAHWLKVQRANSIACWPYQPRTRAWNPLHCHAPSPIPEPPQCR